MVCGVTVVSICRLQDIVDWRRGSCRVIDKKQLYEYQSLFACNQLSNINKLDDFSTWYTSLKLDFLFL